MKQILASFVIFTFVLISGCAPKVMLPPAVNETLTLNWQPVDSLNTTLPPEVRVFFGEDKNLPVRAWYVRAHVKPKHISAHVLYADDTEDRRETTTQLAKDSKACVALNAGYFTMNKKPADHVGLLMTNGNIHFEATGKITRDRLPYEASRAAFGITNEDEVQIGWATTKEGNLYKWNTPLFNFLGIPMTNPDYSQAKRWKVRDALGAGPMILTQNEVRRYWIEELFFGTSIPAVHPRSALGLAKNGDVILMVVDGRQANSRGVSLEELGALMKSAGATEAMNLDGGGSSAIVVNGKRLNSPLGGTFEREVVSAIAIMCEEER